MQNDWILDVLADLKSFAESNGLGALAQQLDDTAMIAAAEISSCTNGVQTKAYGDTDSNRSGTGGFGRHQHA